MQGGEMLDRILEFLPSFLFVAVIALLALAIAKWYARKYRSNLKSVEWLKQNQWKAIWLIGAPLRNVWAPTAEELLFRAPLIVLFSTVSQEAWYGIYVSATIFSLVHWFGKKIGGDEILQAHEDGELESDDIEAEANRLHEEAGNQIVYRRIGQVIATFILGLIAGYYGIFYQSIWISVGIHAVWNLVGTVVIQFIVLISALVILSILGLWERIRFKLKYRAGKRGL